MSQVVRRPRPVAGRTTTTPVLARLGGGLAVAAVSAATGVVLVALAARTHPVVVLLVPAAATGLIAAFTRPWIGIAGVVAGVPLALVGPQLGPFDPIEVLVLGAAGAISLHRLLTGHGPLPWPTVTWWPVGIGLLAVLSATRAPDVTAAIGQLLLLAVGGLAFLATVGALRGPDDVRRVAVTWSLVGLGVSLHALAGAGNLAASSGGLTVAGRPTGVFTSPNQLGAYVGMTLLVALGLALTSRVGWQRLLGGGAAIAATAALGASLSRGAWVGVGVAGLVFVAALPAARRLAGRLVVPVVALAVITGGVLLPRAPTQVQVVSQRFETLTEAETSPYDNRDAIWAEAARQARDEPWLGQGPANFPEVSRRAVSESAFVGADHAHSVPLNTAAEFGLPALLLLVGFAVALLRSARAAIRRLPRVSDRALAAGAGSALVAQVVHGFVDYTLRNATIAVLTWVVAGIVVALARAATAPAGAGT